MTFAAPCCPKDKDDGWHPLCEEQREALRLVLSHRLSITQGGAGTGKSTLIQVIVQYAPSGGGDFVLYIPTGKAARNLESRTGMSARTVHSASGVVPDVDLLAPVNWPGIRLMIPS